MQDFMMHAWDHLLGRLGGPISFRFIVQPIVSIIFGVIAGVGDAKAGRPVYLFDLFVSAANRKARLRETLDALWKIFLVAVILDIIYEIIVFKTIYPVETLVVAFSLTVIPYAIVRGPANRIVRK